MPSDVIEDPVALAARHAGPVRLHLGAMPGNPTFPPCVATLRDALGTPATPVFDALKADADAWALVFVESPALLAARWLTSGIMQDLDAALALWSRCASGTLSHALQYAPRCVLVDLREVEASPASLFALLRDRTGTDVGPALELPFQDAPDPVLLALAVAAVRDCRQARGLWSQLQAATLPLQAESDAVLGVESFDFAAASRRWSALHDAEQRLPALEAQLSQSQQQDQQRALQLERAQAQQLQAEGRAAQSDAALRRAQREAAQARGELELAKARHDSRAQQLDLVLRQLGALRDELHQRAKAKADNPSEAPGVVLRAANIVSRAVVDTPPHQHLELHLSDVRSTAVTMPRLRVRIVHHVGRPGLVLLREKDHPPPLTDWSPDGVEDGSEWVSLIPADARSRLLFERLAPADWRFVTGLFALLEKHLRRQGDANALAWHPVLQLANRQLGALPLRWRYSQIVIEPELGPTRKREVVLHFKDVVFGDENFSTVSLRWEGLGGRDVSAMRLHLLAPPDVDLLPLSDWPTDESLRPLPSWTLPVAAAASAADCRRRWAALSTRDLAFVFGLLDALPGAAPRLDAPGALAASQALHKSARRALQRLRWHHALRSAIRRLGAR